MTVNLYRIAESRFRQIVKPENVFGRSPELVLTLHVEGDAVKDATSFGKIKLELVLGQKTVTVPFDLKDIDLP